MSKYDPLMRDLMRHRGAGRLTYTYANIERILHAPLPRTAYTTRQWWANEQNPLTRHVQCRAWLDAGWRVEDVVLGHQVTFGEIPRAGAYPRREGHGRPLE
jgi:hypothetical protein